MANIFSSIASSLANSFKQNTNANRQSTTSTNKYTSSGTSSATKNASATTSGTKAIGTSTGSTVYKTPSVYNPSTYAGNTALNVGSYATQNNLSSTQAAKLISIAQNDNLNKVGYATKALSNAGIDGTVRVNPTTDTVQILTPYSEDSKRTVVTDFDTGESSLLPTVSEIKEIADYLKNAKDETDDENAKDETDDGGDTTSYNTSYYDDLMAAFLESNEASRQAALDAILKNLDSVKSEYKQQIQDIIDEYSDLVDENEVNKDRARRSVKEAQANRGQLGSGLGRQEQLELNTSYDNKTSDLKSARQKAINEIYNLITQAEAEAETNRATVNSNYDNAKMQYQLAMAEAANS